MHSLDIIKYLNEKAFLEWDSSWAVGRGFSISSEKDIDSLPDLPHEISGRKLLIVGETVPENQESKDLRSLLKEILLKKKAFTVVLCKVNRGGVWVSIWSAGTW